MPFINGQWVDQGDFDLAGRFQKGYDNRMLRGATEDARDAYAAGDPDKAASLIMPYDSQAAAGYRDEGTRKYQRRYADAYGSGDYDKAITEARGRGDLQGLTAARTGQNNSRFRSMVTDANKYRADLRRINQLADPKQKNAAYDAFLAQAAETAKANGNDPRFLSELKQTFPEWNEQAFTALDTMLLQAARAYATEDPESYIQGWVKEQELAATQAKAARDEQRLELEGRRVAATEARTEAQIARLERIGSGGDKPKETVGTTGLTPEQVRLEREFSKDWRGVYTNFNDIQQQYDRIRTMGARKDATGDLALVVSFTKMLDPGSVAREGEVALTQSAASALAQAQNFLPRLQRGNTLLPQNVRNALISAGQEMYAVYRDTYRDIAKQYESTASAYGLDPSRAMMGYRAPTSEGAPPQLPPIGERVVGQTYTMNDGKPARWNGRGFDPVQ